MKVFILLCFCWMHVASSWQEAAVEPSNEVALGEPEGQFGQEPNLSGKVHTSYSQVKAPANVETSRDVQLGGHPAEEEVGILPHMLATAWVGKKLLTEVLKPVITQLAVDTIAGVQKGMGADTLTIGGILELNCDQLVEFILILTDGIKEVLHIHTDVKINEGYDLSPLSYWFDTKKWTQDLKDERSFALTDYAFKLLVQAWDTIDFLKTAWNIAAKVATDFTDYLKKIGKTAKEMAGNALAWMKKKFYDIWNKLGDLGKRLLTKFRNTMGFEPWEVAPLAGYSKCADGPITTPCMCFMSKVEDDCKGEACVPDDVKICQPGFSCKDEKCITDTTIANKDVKFDDGKGKDETSEEKKTAVYDLIKALVTYFGKTRIFKNSYDPRQDKIDLGAVMWDSMMVLLNVPKSLRTETQLAALPLPAPTYEQETEVAKVSSSAEEPWKLNKAYLVFLLLPAVKIIYDYTKKQTVDIEFDVEASLLK